MYPLHLELTEEQALFAETTRRLIESELPLAAVRARADSGAALDRARWRRQAELGWLGLLVPESSGGGCLTGSGVLDLTIVAAELGRLVQPGPVLPAAIVAGALGADPGGHHGELLAGIVAGDTVATWCAPDPARWWGGDPELRVGTGPDAVLHGSARFVTDAQDADVLLVAAAGPAGPVQLVVPASAPGVRIEPLESLDLARRLAHVHLDGVAVDRSSVVGEPGSAGPVVDRQLDLAVLLQTVETVGAIDRVFDVTLEYAVDRMAFGRPIGSYQAIKHRLADMLTSLESCKATVMGAAASMEAGEGSAPELVSTAKSFVGRAAPTLVQDCVQVHGGIGVTWDHDLHLYLRRVAANAALLGTPADHERRLAALIGAEG